MILCPQHHDRYDGGSGWTGAASTARSVTQRSGASMSVVDRTLPPVMAAHIGPAE